MTLKTGGNSVKTFHCFKGVICRKWPVFKGSSKHIGGSISQEWLGYITWIKFTWLLLFFTSYSFSIDDSIPLKKHIWGHSLELLKWKKKRKHHRQKTLWCNRTKKETDVSQVIQHQLHLSGFVTTSAVREVSEADPCLWEGRWYPGILLGATQRMWREVRGRQTEPMVSLFGILERR